MTREDAEALRRSHSAGAGEREYLPVKDDGMTYAWLVERDANGRIEYWDGLNFVTDAEEAMWFCRRIDASLAGALCNSAHRATLHAFDLKRRMGDRQEFAKAALRQFKNGMANSAPADGQAAPYTGKDAERLAALRKRVDDARDFPTHTDPASRHLQMIADALADGEDYTMLREEPQHCAETMFAVLASLWEARASDGQAAQELITALETQDPHDTDEVIKVMMAAATALRGIPMSVEIDYSKGPHKLVNTAKGSEHGD